MLHAVMLVKVCFFSIFHDKKAEKLKTARKLNRNLVHKTICFKNWWNNPLGVAFLHQKMFFFLGIKHSTSIWMQTRKPFFLNFPSMFLLFLPFSAFLHKTLRSIFQPTFGVRSTQMLVEIYNKHLS